MTLECVCTIWVSNERCNEILKGSNPQFYRWTPFRDIAIKVGQGLTLECFVRYGYQTKGVTEHFKREWALGL